MGGHAGQLALKSDLRLVQEYRRSLLPCLEQARRPTLDHHVYRSSGLGVWVLISENWYYSFPLPFIAILTGWYTAEVGRQPWVVYGVLRTAEAVTPTLNTRAAAVSLVVFCAVYAFIFAFGIFYIYRLLRAGPIGGASKPPSDAVPNRPMSLAAER